MADLWAEQRRQALEAAEPLAARMRPRRLEEFVGQEHFLGPGKLLRRMLEADRLSSLIFYGPPGVGKTTLACLIAARCRCHFERANAAAIGVSQIRRVLEEAAARLADPGDSRRTILFLDEIHRFNRAQQDVLLEDMERGVVLLIGATTQNPFFSLNGPLISRSALFQFEPLGEPQIRTVVERALRDPERGYGRMNVRLEPDALTHWARVCDGDARRVLTALEIAVRSSASPPGEPEAGRDRPLVIDRQVAEESIQRKAIDYDRDGDPHYDVISAFIKAMRGSDPDATVYWLARMLEAGEDPLFIARRIAILASEDIGNADPRALEVASAACQVTERIGLPECQLTLSQAAIYMATAPKSNASARAVWSARRDVREQRTLPVPRHLRDSHYRGAAALGHGEGYRYAHDGPDGWVDQDYLGVDRTYYEPTDRGHERAISAYLVALRRSGEAGRGDPGLAEPTEK